MPSVFDAAPAAPAVPITFVTKATWGALSATLPAGERQFAQASGYAAKPGECLMLPAVDGRGGFGEGGPGPAAEMVGDQERGQQPDENEDATDQGGALHAAARA